MKKRTFTLLNFLALNVLFFAIYLNFVHEDVNAQPVVSATTNAAVKTPAANEPKHVMAAHTPEHEKAMVVEN